MMISTKNIRLSNAAALMALLPGGIIGLVVTNKASAATFSQVNGDYNTAANWSPVGVPTTSEAQISNAAGRNATFNSAVTITNSSRLLVGLSSGNSGSLTLSGIAGTLNFTSNSTLNAANYIGVDGGSGTLNVNAGTINFTTADTTGAGNLHIAANAGTSSGLVTLDGGTINVGTRVTIGALGAVSNGSGLVGSSGNGNGTLTINSGTMNIGTTTLAATGAEVNKGYLSLKGTTTGTGTATVNLNGGTLSLLRFQIGTPATKVINFNGGTVQARGNDTNFLDAVTGSTTNVGNGGAIFNTNSFNITVGSALVNNGSGGLQKLGAGTLTLTGANTYIGTTDITTGTLALSGTGTLGTGNVIVNGILDIAGVTSASYTLGTAQVLSGDGTIIATGKTLNVNGTLAPGNSAGSLDVTGNLVLASTATSNFEIDGPSSNDLLAVTGSLAYAGALNINTTQTTGSFDLFNFSSLTGDFDSITLSNAFTGSLTPIGGGIWTGNNGSVAATFTGSTGVLEFSVIPEPSTLVLGGLALLGFAGLRLRRRNRTS